jgi:hypothetical protein
MTPDNMTNSQIEKIHAEIVKLNAETAKINGEARYYPLIVSATVVLSFTALAKLFIS